MSFRKIQDGITPDLRKKAQSLAPGGRQRLLRAMGVAVVSIGKRAFTDPSLRASRWAPRQDDERHPLLIKKVVLLPSIRIMSTSSDSVTIGSDRPYAAAHQLGSKKQGIPARPFLPFKGKQLTKVGATGVSRALRAGLKSAGL